MSKVTLKEIGRTLGLSPATVSKALKDYPDISEDTKRKVVELAESLNYKPNSFAQSLRNQESKIIGLIIPDIVHHFFSNIIKGAINEAKKAGYLVILLQTDEDYENEKRQLQLLVEKNVDGILLSLADNTVQFDHLKEIINQGVPIVLYDKMFKVIQCSKVIINDKKAAYDATAYLIKTGCKKIAHVCGPLKPQTTIDRYLGYKQALEDHGIAFDSSLIYTVDQLGYDDGYEAADQIMKTHPDIDGLFAFTDLVATGALVRFKELGISIPDQISIVGFSNWFLSRITTPKLTTVNQPGYDMGRKAFQLLHQQLIAMKQGEDFAHEIVEVPTELIVRNTTKPV